METSPVRVRGFDHLVLRVRNIERSLAFYLGDLGLEPERLDEWRAGSVPFPSARISQTALIDFIEAAEDDRRGSNVDHFCLVVERIDWDAVVTSGRFRVAGRPATRFGAQGTAVSLYVLDPDDNTVELRWYPVDT